MSERAYGCLLLSEAVYRSLRVPSGDCGWLLLSEGAYWCLRMPTGALGCLLVPSAV